MQIFLKALKEVNSRSILIYLTSLFIGEVILFKILINQETYIRSQIPQLPALSVPQVACTCKENPLCKVTAKQPHEVDLLQT